MSERRYEVVEKDKDAQYRVLNGLVSSPAHGTIYMLLMSGEPLSTTDITSFLTLSDRLFTDQFQRAVVQLEADGLIRALEDHPAGTDDEPEWLVSWEELLPQESAMCAGVM